MWPPIRPIRPIFFDGNDNCFLQLSRPQALLQPPDIASIPTSTIPRIRVQASPWRSTTYPAASKRSAFFLSPALVGSKALARSLRSITHMARNHEANDAGVLKDRPTWSESHPHPHTPTESHTTTPCPNRSADGGDLRPPEAQVRLSTLLPSQSRLTPLHPRYSSAAAPASEISALPGEDPSRCMALTTGTRLRPYRSAPAWRGRNRDVSPRQDNHTIGPPDRGVLE